MKKLVTPYPNLIVRLSESYYCSVTLRVPPLAHAHHVHAHHIIAWVTRPERPKGAKDEVKEARRAAD